MHIGVSLIQIQIQIESLHSRLDEIGEMTSAGVIPAGPFLSMCTMREPRAMLAALRLQIQIQIQIESLHICILPRRDRSGNAL